MMYVFEGGNDASRLVMIGLDNMYPVSLLVANLQVDMMAMWAIQASKCANNRLCGLNEWLRSIFSGWANYWDKDACITY